MAEESKTEIPEQRTTAEYLQELKSNATKMLTNISIIKEYLNENNIPVNLDLISDSLKEGPGNLIRIKFDNSLDKLNASEGKENLKLLYKSCGGTNESSNFALMKETIINFFQNNLDNSESKNLFDLIKLDISVSQAELVKLTAKNLNIPEVEGSYDDPNLLLFELGKNKKMWNEVCREAALSLQDIKKLLPLMRGANKIISLRKAAGSTAGVSDEATDELIRGKNLKKFLEKYYLNNFKIHSIFDFDAKDINDDYIKDTGPKTVMVPMSSFVAMEQGLQQDDQDHEPGEEEPEIEVIDYNTGKNYVRQMALYSDKPGTFTILNEYKGNKLNENVVTEDGTTYYMTEKLPLVNEYSQISVSREVSEGVDYFENNKDKFIREGKKISDISIPLYIVYSCLKRVKDKKTKDKKTKEYKKDVNGNFVYTAFHISIIILFDGKIYTLGYGLDAEMDKTKKEKNQLGPLLTLLQDFEKTIKLRVPSFESVSLFGTGIILSPDSLDIDDESFSYDIIDMGILEKKHIMRLNTIFSSISQLYANTMVIEGKKDYDLTIDTFIGETNTIYSRLSSSYLQTIQRNYKLFDSFTQIMNCSSFSESIFYDSIDCSKSKFLVINSDPNKCISKNANFSDKRNVDEKIKEVFNIYFEEATTVSDFVDSLTKQPLPVAVAVPRTIRAAVAPSPPAIDHSGTSAMGFSSQQRQQPQGCDPETGTGCVIAGGAPPRQSTKKQKQKNKKKNKTIKK